ncbi:hypothetical protein HMPREF1063_03820 [Phocaeicola dorei CL02T00C15]|nr:hypothetical protein HMPREF1063_03820 [Phocaeicola dorei CL02T00C15]
MKPVNLWDSVKCTDIKRAAKHLMFNGLCYMVGCGEL